MPAFDPGQHRRDVTVLAIQRKAALRVVPGKAGQAAVDCRDREGTGRRPGGEIRKVKPDHLGRGRHRLGPFHPTPAGEMCPVLGIGLQRIVRRCGAGVVACGIHQTIEAARPGDTRGQGDVVAFILIALGDVGTIKLIRAR